jgi:hypothetical protein
LSTQELSVKIIEHTPDPIKLLYRVWNGSRSDKSDAVIGLYYYTDEQKSRQEVSEILRMDIPILEFIHFVWMIEDIPIGLREQLVRHGKFNSFWSQTTRVRPLEEFYDSGQFLIPDSIAKDPELERLYLEHLERTQTLIKVFKDAEVPQDNFRMLLTTAYTHRLYVCSSYRALTSILSKRSCQIAQFGLWKPLIVGLVEELRKIDPLLADVLLVPPCIDKKTDQYVKCPYYADNMNRLTLNDPAPVCSLFCQQELANVATGVTPHTQDGKRQAYLDQRDYFERLWGRDPLTFEKK